MPRINKIIKYLLVLGPGAVLLLLQKGTFWSAYWFTKWTVVYVCFAVFFSAWASLRTSLWFFPLICTSTVSASWILSSAYTVFDGPGYSLLIRESLGRASAMSLVSIVAACLFIIKTPRRFSKPIYTFIAAVCAYSVVLTLMKYGTKPYFRVGVSGNASMNGTLIAFTAPFLCAIHPVMMVPVSVAILMTGASIPIGVAAVTLSSFMFSKVWNHRLRYTILMALIIPIVFVCVALVLFGSIPATAIDSSGRFETWRVLFRDWWQHYSPIFGSGQGTGIVTFDIAQNANAIKIKKDQYERFLWMHSDWLQILYETGIVGLVSSTVAAYYLARRSLNRPYLFASVMGIYAAGLFNYPLHLPISAVCIAMVVYLALDPSVKLPNNLNKSHF